MSYLCAATTVWFPSCPIPWMSSVLMNLHFLVRKICDIVVIKFFILFFWINELPELVWIVNFWANVSLGIFLLIDFSDLIIVNIKFFLTS